LSDQHWTPLSVAVQAAAWLDEFQVRTVIDLGSGAGKFCVAAALAGRCHFTGLEQRPALVQAARALARTFGVEGRACFIQGALGEVRLPVVDAYYLYNPFEENSPDYVGRIDEAVELSEARQASDVLAVRELLLAARVGTYVLVYNGFGGRLPDVYREVRSEHELPNVLRLWQKARPSASRRPSGARTLCRGNGGEGMCLRS
jgi:SAM-dependent methyltransferase